MPHRNLYAAVDLGSNSFHMLVARREHGELRVIDRIREMVRLAGGLDERGRLEPEVRDRALACLARFGQRLANIPRDQVRAVGTQTLRRLARPASFLVVAETALGHPVDIISGREEARLVWLGVAGGTSFGDRPRMLIDIGGGSTEIAAGHSQNPEVAESIQFGCVSVTRRAFGKGRITPRRWRRARDEIATELQALRSPLEATGWQLAIGSSGTIRAVQGMVAAAGDGVNGPIRATEVARLRDAILAAGHVERVSLAGLSSSRQPVISGGVLVLEACMQAFDIQQLEVSPAALREGVLDDLFGRLAHADPRQASVRAMAERFGCDQAQAERVRDFALTGFEQIAEAFGLAPIHRDLLEWTCLLHEIGLAIAHSHYQRHSAYLVEHSDMAGFSRQEQQFMAVLLHGQRRKLKRDALEDLPDRLVPAARALLMLLRMAVALARPRSDADLPDFALETEGKDKVRLALPDGWLQAHPLSARSLALEKTQLKTLGLKLNLGVLQAGADPARADASR